MSGTGSSGCPVLGWEVEIHRLGRVLLIVYLLETGLVLMVAPWSAFWERNLLVETSPLLGGVVRLAAVRGAVSGVGVVNLCAGAWELAVSLIARPRPAGVSVPRSPERRVRGESPVLYRDR